jgi:DNA-binding XRE family transcriptional regulator
MTQTQLARLVDCHINTIHRIECGTAVPDLKLAGRIAKVFGRDVSFVFRELLTRDAAL